MSNTKDNISTPVETSSTPVEETPKPTSFKIDHYNLRQAEAAIEKLAGAQVTKAVFPNQIVDGCVVGFYREDKLLADGKLRFQNTVISDPEGNVFIQALFSNIVIIKPAEDSLLTPD